LAALSSSAKGVSLPVFIREHISKRRRREHINDCEGG
jgi:hypothetical protein